MEDVRIVTVAGNLTKALAFENSQNPSWTVLNPTGVQPAIQVTSGGTSGTNTGVFQAGQAGYFINNRLRIIPYCFGAPGSQFSFRVFGWESLSQPEGQAQTLVWIPYLLAEFACVACNQPGPSDNQMRLIQPGENFCDTITLTQGSLGKDGVINSTGAAASAAAGVQTPTDLIAYVLLDLCGCRMFQVDFQQTDAVSMNALLAFA